MSVAGSKNALLCRQRKPAGYVCRVDHASGSGRRDAWLVKALEFRSLSRCFGRLDCPVDSGELPLKPKWLQKRPQVEPVVFRRIVLSVICSSAWPSANLSQQTKAVAARQ